MARRRSSPSGGRETTARAPTQRQLRVGELIRHALSELLLRDEIRDPALAGVSVTVSEVRPSPDLRNASCFVVALGGQDTEAVVAALNTAAPWISGRVARSVRTKFAPRLRFLADTSFEEAQRIDSLLHSDKVAGDLHPREAGEDDGQA